MPEKLMRSFDKQNSGDEVVLLLAHGTPDVLSEMSSYLERVTGGRKVSPEVVHELQERYSLIGLTDSPSAEGPHLTKWTYRVASLLQERLNKRVYVAMRNWKPFIGDVVEEMKKDGVRRVQVLCMAPQNSRTSVGLFKHAVETAVGDSMTFDFISRWSDHPKLVSAFAQRLQAALENIKPERDGRVAVLFTAHSVPTRTVRPSETPVEHHGMILATSPDTYESDCRETARLIAEKVGKVVGTFDSCFSFQSQGMSGGPWIGPTVEETLVDLKKKGHDTVIIQPVGFVCDHVEILYDIDIAFQKSASELGLKLIRTESLNDSSLLIDALEDLVLNTSYSKQRRGENSSSAEKAVG